MGDTTDEMVVSEVTGTASGVDGGAGGVGGGGGMGGGGFFGKSWLPFPFDLSAFDVIWDSYMVPLSIITVALGLLANTWVLGVGISRNNLRTSSFHLLLMNHSLANFVSCACTYPIMILKYSYGRQHSVQSPELCMFWSVTICAITCVGLLSNGLVAVNRAASCYPQLKFTPTLRSTQTAVTSIAVVWVICILYFVFPAVFLHDSWKWVFSCVTVRDMFEMYVLKRGTPNKESAKLFMNMGLGLSSFIPFIMCCVSYGIIVKYLYGQNHGGGAASEQRRRDKLRALITIIVVFLIFVICRVPSMIIMIHEAVILIDNPILMWTPMLDSTLNPFVYLITMPAFRPKFLTKGHAVHPASGSNSQQPTRITRVKEDK